MTQSSDLPVFPFHDILTRHTELSISFLSKVNRSIFYRYLTQGYYPFFLRKVPMCTLRA
jgi:hypothetical protein